VNMKDKEWPKRRRKLMANGFPTNDIVDEQAAVLSLRDHGFLVFVGCSHPGVINMVQHAIDLTGISKVHAIIGGLHLDGSLAESSVRRTEEALAEFEPDLIVPSHCSGYRAIAMLADRMPDTFLPNSIDIGMKPLLERVLAQREMLKAQTHVGKLTNGVLAACPSNQLDKTISRLTVFS